MILINKGNTPEALSIAKKKGLICYDDMRSDLKTTVKEELLQEQGYLCAYCMCRIQQENSTIEHYRPISVDSALDLEYSNMLAVCPGGAGSTFKNQTCDERRGNTALTVNPLKPMTLSGISYQADGRIVSSQPQVQADFDNVLNLNLDTLKENRIYALNALKKKLYADFKKRGASRAAIESYLLQLQHKDKRGKYLPYMGILVAYLEKRLRQF